MLTAVPIATRSYTCCADFSRRCRNLRGETTIRYSGGAGTGLGVTCLEFSDDLRQRQTFDFEQQQHVVEEIRGFADDFRVGLCDGGQRQLQAFLADFLRDPPGAFRDEFGGVAARRTRGDSLGDDLFEPAQERDALRARLGRTLAPPGGRALMAGGTRGFGHYQQCVAVAIGSDLFDLEKGARGLALCPEAALSAAPKRDAARRLRRREGPPIPISPH